MVQMQSKNGDLSRKVLRERNIRFLRVQGKISLRLFWNKIFPSLTNWKTFEFLTESFFDENALIFLNYYSKYDESNVDFHFSLNVFTVRVEKIKDRWRQSRQQKNVQKGLNWVMRPTLTRFLECSLAFMKKWKTLFDYKVYKG